MSVHVSARVWDECRQSGEALLVILALADHSNDDGVSWPSLDRIAEMARVERRSVVRILHRLEEAAEVVVERGGGRGHTNRYVLSRYARLATGNGDSAPLLSVETVTPGSPIPNGNSDTASPIGATNGDPVSPLAGRETVTLATETVTLGAETVTPGSPEPSEPSLNHQEEKDQDPLRDDQRMFESLCSVYGTTPASIMPNPRGRLNSAIKAWSASGVTPELLDTAIGLYRQSFKGSKGEKPSQLDLENHLGEARAGRVPEAAAIDAAVAAGVAEAEQRFARPLSDPASELLGVAKEDLRLRMVPGTFKAYFASLAAVSLDASVLVVRAPNPGAEDWLRRRGGMQLLNDAVAHAAPGTTVQLVGAAAMVEAAA